MNRRFFHSCALAALCLVTSASAHAGGKDRPDPFVENAIKQTAQAPPPAAAPEPAPVEDPAADEESVIAEIEPLPEPEPEALAEAATPAARPMGLRAGNLLFLPELVLQQDYNTNVRAEDENEESDFITRFLPRLRIKLAESNHDVALDIWGEQRVHWEHGTEDRIDFGGSFGGKVAASDALKFPFMFRWERPHEERLDDITRQRPDEPLQQDKFLAEGGMEWVPGSVGMYMLGRYKKLRHDDGHDALGNRVIRRDADHDETEAEMGMFFDFNPHNRFSVSGMIGEHDYQQQNFQAGGFTGPRRGSEKYNVKAGWRFDYAGLLADLKIGVENFNYEDGALGNVREIIGNLNIEHDLSERTVLNVRAARDIHEDEEFVSPIVRTTAGVFVDHEMRENILLGAGADYGFWEFQDTARDDDYWTLRAMGDYILTDRASVGAEYNYVMRDSEQAGADADQSIVMLRLRGRL